jgi:hypothetical protein
MQNDRSANMRNIHFRNGNRTSTPSVRRHRAGAAKAPRERLEEESESQRESRLRLEYRKFKLPGGDRRTGIEPAHIHGLGATDFASFKKGKEDYERAMRYYEAGKRGRNGISYWLNDSRTRNNRETEEFEEDEEDGKLQPENGKRETVLKRKRKDSGAKLVEVRKKVQLATPTKSSDNDVEEDGV